MTEAHDWAGVVGDTWAAEWRRTDRSFAGLAPHLDAAILVAAPETGRAVDIGCGAGATSIALATARPGLTVTGIDLSPALIDTARKRAADLANLSFETGGVERALPPLAPVDLLFSRHGVMFFDDPVSGFTLLRSAVGVGAGLVFSCFRTPAENPWAAEVAGAILGAPPQRPSGYVPGPFAFAEPLFVGDVLAKAGWGSDEPVAVDFTYRAGAGEDPVGDALDFFRHIGPAAPLLRAAAPDELTAMIDRLRSVLESRATADAVDFPAAAWLWSGHAL